MFFIARPASFSSFCDFVTQNREGYRCLGPSLDLPLGLVEKAEKGEGVLRHNSDIVISIHAIM